MVFLYFSASTVNISYGVFTFRKIICMGLTFLLFHDENFYFIFLMQVLRKNADVKM
jgi:hypothetical protein